jgi:hypothetical protein
MPIIIFQKLWESHPLNWTPPQEHPCRKEDNTWDSKIDNQCAVKMSISLMGAGIDMNACSKRRCWIKGHKNHILAAQELADWLATKSMLGTPKKLLQPKGNSLADVQQSPLLAVQMKKGIVFFQDFWGTNNTGDHIDVWDGTMMPDDYRGEKLSYFRRAKQVWFWEINV